MGTVIDLQLSWFAALFVMLSVRPVHAPTLVPTGMFAATGAVPVMEKSACVHAGLAASACALNAVTEAVTAVMNTCPLFELSNVPERADEPPGKSPLGVPVCFTTTDAAVPVVALPVPDPLVVQYAIAMPASANDVTTMATMTTGLDQRTRISWNSKRSMDEDPEGCASGYVHFIGLRPSSPHE